ncbi:45 kDa calcium-binding protein isoform X1 [Vespa crabro]|uniref:45 kDa calcium-binding protein isoform X1 n=1 Tax=Vespa crabro TaxID=7445 RepID=UPI001EFFC959|nr:45 kDa calcium-binding protein isoform X1 [Vespa crabro]
MICRANNFPWLRLLRCTILVALVIYVSFLIVWYKKNFPLRSPASVPSNDDKEKEDNAIESLFFELEAATVGKKERDRYENVALDRISDEESIREHEETENREDPKSLLEDIFRRADVDENQLLDIQELAKWIHAKITEHVRRAMRDNVGLFTAIDNNPRNGEVSWEEYHAHFLRMHGFSESYVRSHDKRHREMSRTLKESIMRDRARWTDAARNDPEKLTLDEFLAFTHPESSHRALLQMVEDLFEKFDRDGDEQLTEDEFSDLPSEGVGLELDEDRHQTVGGSADRRKEFRHLIDKNKNGKADRTELLMYIDPRNPRHAIQEAQHLISLSDINLDGKLNLSEVLSKTDLFLCSKMVDTEKSFHDEF